MNQLPGDVHFHSPLSEDKDQEKNKGYWKEPEPEAYETSNLFGAIRHQTIDPKLARYQELNVCKWIIVSYCGCLRQC